MLGWLEKLQRLTGVHFTAQQTLAVGAHYELPPPAIVRLVDDVVDWVAFNARLDPQRRWIEEEITNRFRIFGRKAAKDCKPTADAPPLPDAHADHARLVREAKEREHAYEQRKAAEQRAFRQRPVNPAYQVAVDIGKGRCNAPTVWKRMSTTPSGRATQDERAGEVQRFVSDLAAESHGREHGPP